MEWHVDIKGCASHYTLIGKSLDIISYFDSYYTRHVEVTILQTLNFVLSPERRRCIRYFLNTNDPRVFEDRYMYKRS